jgi:hypothetical protein
VRLDPKAPDGFVTFSHSGDRWQDCRDLVRHKLGLPAWQPGDGRQRQIPDQHVPVWDFALIEDEATDIPQAWTEDELARIAHARRIWDEGQDPRGTLAETYLRQCRKLDLSDALAGQVLRFHERCPWRNENTGATVFVPALLAVFRQITDNTVTAVHRIALNDNGSKIERRMLGVVRRTAIKFDVIDGDTLHIGEGIETCLAGRELGFTPAWALGSVGAISFFPLLEPVRTLTIFGETGEASASAITICNTRWRKAGRRVRVVMPDEGLSDLNDVLIAERSAS